MFFCKYKNIFGAENTGVHQYRIFDIAVVDLIGTIIGAGLIAYFANINFLIVFAIVMLCAIIIHRLFCVNTTINKIIFGLV
jgi:uncharacterized membrane protein YcaP (DUF421 family)